MTLHMSSAVLCRSYQLTCPIRGAGRLPFITPIRQLSTTGPSTVSGMDKVHEVSKAGFKQGQHYDKNRPSYTDEITLHVVKNLFKGKNTAVKYNILELGAGTGKFTRKLQPLLGKDFRYLASDPSKEFLDILQEQSPDVETQMFSAYDIPLPDCSVQNIVCAQSYHWCANKECMDEITRVLVPQGRILCVWNHKNWELGWVKDMEDVLTTYYRVETPRAYLRKWHSFVEAYNGVKTVENSKFPGLPNMKGNKDFVVDHFSSISVISLLDAKENNEARAKFRAILDTQFPGDQEITIPLTSEYYCAEKL